MEAPTGTWNWRVPCVVGTTTTLKTPGAVSSIESIVMSAVPALSKSASLTVISSMSLLKLKV